MLLHLEWLALSSMLMRYLNRPWHLLRLHERRHISSVRELPAGADWVYSLPGLHIMLPPAIQTMMHPLVTGTRI